MVVVKMLLGTVMKVIVTIVIIVMIILLKSGAPLILWIIFALPSILAIPAALEHRVVSRKGFKDVSDLIETEFLPQDKAKRKWSKCDGDGTMNYRLDLSVYRGPVVSVYLATENGVTQISLRMTEWLSGGGVMPMFWAFDPWWVHGAARANSKIRKVTALFESATVATSVKAPEYAGATDADASAAPARSTAHPKAAPTYVCPVCEYVAPITVNFCKGCGHRFEAQDILETPATSGMPTAQPVFSNMSEKPVQKSELDGATAALAQLLDANGIRYSVEQEGKSDIQYRGKNTYLRIEITQFFSNAGCAMTYLNKQWRDNPFAEGDIGNIDISISSQHEYFVSILYPQNLAHDFDALEHVKQQIESLKMQAESDLYKGMQCADYLGTPGLWFTYAMNDPSKDTPDYAFAFLQLLALEIHRIFGSIVVPTGASVTPPESNVIYTPDITDANGGYFVYGSDGYLWWLIDKDFKFRSIIGEVTWQEQKDAEASGLPLTSVDYDNLYRYEGGLVYGGVDGKLVGRYYPERYDAWQMREKGLDMLINGDYLARAEGFGIVCELYRLFPEGPYFGIIEEGCGQIESGIGNSNSNFRKEAKLTGKHLLNLADKCPDDSKIQQLADRVRKVLQEKKGMKK